MSVDYLRKITGQRLKYKTNEGNIVNLIIVLEDKRGHRDQFTLANIQHIATPTAITNKNKKDNKDKTATTITTKVKYSVNDRMIINDYTILLQDLNSNPNPELHHLSLKTDLKNKQDYKRVVDWHMPYDKNKARILENAFLFIELTQLWFIQMTR